MKFYSGRSNPNDLRLLPDKKIDHAVIRKIAAEPEVGARIDRGGAGLRTKNGIPRRKIEALNISLADGLTVLSSMVSLGNTAPNEPVHTQSVGFTDEQLAQRAQEELPHLIGQFVTLLANTMPPIDAAIQQEAAAGIVAIEQFLDETDS